METVIEISYMYIYKTTKPPRFPAVCYGGLKVLFRQWLEGQRMFFPYSLGSLSKMMDSTVHSQLIMLLSSIYAFINLVQLIFSFSFLFVQGFVLFLFLFYYMEDSHYRTQLRSMVIHVGNEHECQNQELTGYS